MEYSEALKIGKEKAERALSRGWDTEAFEVLTLIKLIDERKDVLVADYTAKVDLIPESQVDEMTDLSKDSFVKYMKDRTTVNFDKYLRQTHQVLSEVYHTLNNEPERVMFRDFVENMKNIYY